MKIAPYVTKLNESDVFKNFQKEFKNTFIVAGFFVLDMEEGKNVHQIDYYVPDKKKIAAFTLDKGVTMQMLDLMNSKVPDKLDLKTNIDLDQIPGILEDEMKNRSITADIKKIIAIIQNVEGKKVWNLSCVLSGMTILNAHVEDTSKTVLKMEKKSIMDFVQKMSPEQFKGKLQAQAGGGAAENPKMSKKDVALQIKKLDDLEQAIEKEKDALSKQSPKENKVKTNAKKK